MATLGLGTLATLLFFQEPGFYVGFGAKLVFHEQPADISSFVGVGVSAVLFVVLLRFSRRPATA